MTIPIAKPAWSLGYLDQVTLCPLCGASGAGKVLGARRDDCAAFSDAWRYLECGRCRGLFLSPRPDAESLSLAYRDYYTHSSPSPSKSARASGLAGYLINSWMNFRYRTRRESASRLAPVLWYLLPPLRMKLDFVARHMPRERCGQGHKLLDIGCGNGDFLALAREMGFAATGCEPDSASVAICRAQGLDVMEGDAFHLELQENTFDVITMNHVLEHVVDQAALLSRAYRLLAPGGRIWVCLPNPQALGRSSLGIAWKGFHPPYHLALPTPDWVRTAMEDAGFEGPRQISRGPQSRGLWKESFELAQREGRAVSRMTQVCLRFASNLLGLLTPRWDEEQIHVARKPAPP